MGKPRRQRGARIRLDLVVANPKGPVILDPFMEVLRDKAKALGYRVLDTDVVGFDEVKGNVDIGWEAESESYGTPW